MDGSNISFATGANSPSAFIDSYEVAKLKYSSAGWMDVLPNVASVLPSSSDAVLPPDQYHTHKWKLSALFGGYGHKSLTSRRFGPELRFIGPFEAFAPHQIFSLIESVGSQKSGLAKGK